MSCENLYYYNKNNGLKKVRRRPDQKTHGTYHKEIIPFSKALILMGFDKATWLPNGLGGELENQGLAKAFDINTSWQQKLNCEQEQGLQTIGKMRPQSTGHSIVFP